MKILSIDSLISNKQDIGTLGGLYTPPIAIADLC